MTAVDLNGATVIISGASGGFGRATAVALAKSGAQVVGVARHRGGLEELQREQAASEYVPMRRGPVPPRNSSSSAPTRPPRPARSPGTWSTSSRTGPTRRRRTA
jgi:NAD(P)-dependent dehydrogenase (short-subunit alcohol dehydrogenase family)